MSARKAFLLGNLTMFLGWVLLIVVVVVFAPDDDESLPAATSTPIPALAATPRPSTPRLPSTTTQRGTALIDELIACDGPGLWNRAILLNRLDRDGEKEIERVQQLLDGCKLANTIATRTPPSTPSPVPTPGESDTPATFSEESLELLANYHELLRFKDEPWFHILCYSANGPANVWAGRISSLGNIGTLSETGILSSDLWSMGLDYCQNDGQETDYTRQVKGDMKDNWINYRPVPTPKPLMQVTSDHFYERLNRELAACLWGNPSMATIFPEAYEAADSEAELATILGAVLYGAESKATIDGALIALAMCKQ